MKTNLIKSGAILGIGALLITTSCKKEVLPGFTPSSAEVAIGEPVSFTDNEAERKNSSFTWDFGDGTTSTERNPSHVYAKPGTYTVSQTVSLDKNAEKGKSLKASSQSTVTVVGPTVNFTTPKTTFASGEGIVFTNSTTASEKGSPVTYTWSYVSSNGASEVDWNNNASFAAQFTDPGVYTITLTVTQGNYSVSKSMDITVTGGVSSTANAAIKAIIVGEWNHTSDETNISGSTGDPGCETNGTTNSNTTTERIVFEQDGSTYSFKSDGDQTTGTWLGGWNISADGKIFLYAGNNYEITATATQIILKNVFINDGSTGQLVSDCGAWTRTRTITLDK